MAKYSTGGSSGSGEADACELCGTESASLRPANVAGADLDVCPDCAPHDDNAHKDNKKTDQSGGGSDRNPVEAANSDTTMWDGDTSHWEEEGTDYEEDRLPYLVDGYGKAVVEARQDAGLQREELADELGVRESDLLAVEQGRAAKAGIGGSVIAALEERLDVELSEQGP